MNSASQYLLKLSSDVYSIRIVRICIDLDYLDLDHGLTDLFLYLIFEIDNAVDMHLVFSSVCTVAPFLEMAKYSTFMAKTWFSYGPSNWFFLNHNHCSQGCSMPKFHNAGCML